MKRKKALKDTTEMPLFPRDISALPAALHLPDESVIHKYQQLTIFLKMQ